MRYWKCVGLDDKSSNFTLGRVYESDDNGFGIVNDDGVHMLGLSTLAKYGTWNSFNTKFTEVSEQDYINQEKGEDKMKNIRNLIVVGRIVKFDDGKISKVEINRWEELSFSGEHWFPVARLNSDLKYSGMKIVEIYGRCSSNEDAWKLSTDYRDLIWKRTEKSPAQLKLEELEKKQRELADEMEKLRKEM